MRETLDFLRHWSLYIWMFESAFAFCLCLWTIRVLRVWRKTHPGEQTLMPFLSTLAKWRITFVSGLFLLGPLNLWTQKYVPRTSLPPGLPAVVYLSSIFTLLILILFPAKEAWLAYKEIVFLFSGGSVKQELARRKEEK